MVGLKRMELEELIEYELYNECKNFEILPNKEKLIKAITSAVSYVIARNNLELDKDIKVLLDKKTEKVL